jgi:hypothetical protein
VNVIEEVVGDPGELGQNLSDAPDRARAVMVYRPGRIPNDM